MGAGHCNKILLRFTGCHLFIKTPFLDIPTWPFFVVSFLFCFEKGHDSPFFFF